VSPVHHPEQALLIDYASGAIVGGARLVIGGHLGACQTCRTSMMEWEAVGGALLSNLSPAAMSRDALELALARIERPAPSIEPTPVGPADWIAIPSEALRASSKRRRWAAPGVWVAPISHGPGGARSYLLRVGPGMSVPRHSHRGEEMVLVLKGAYDDGETRHGPGDFAINNEAVDHQPRITDDGECVCLIAAEHALVPRDWVGRLFQPFVGI
jgi:putative transcriptional regulator